jgi:superfamily II DNA or RNA helicase/diadenosine tetraphosphate (Ap4A) HIT family hydrolase/HKD family nuclease
VAGCPFCARSGLGLVLESAHVIAFEDAHPVAHGHTLVVPRRHVVSVFDLEADEQRELWAAVASIKAQLDASDPPPDGYNVGFNLGRAAGQTVEHAHVHVIPRRHGDVYNPRGGVRWVIPAKADDLRAPAPASVIDIADLAIGPSRPLGPWLVHDLERAVTIDLCVAFIWQSGVDHIYPALAACLERNGRVRIVTGDYHDLTDPRALRALLDLGGPPAMQLRVFETGANESFHPKAYLVSKSDDELDTVAYVGSSNLSRTALEHGHEWNLRLTGLAGVERARQAFDALFEGRAVPVTEAWLRRYATRRAVRLPSPSRDHTEPPEPPEPPEPAPEPHAIQREALAALAATRAAGNRAGLVVLATGLGKTWLAAFDSADADAFPRVLFVAHRDEILRQAMRSFRAIRPDASFGLYTGADKQPDADVLFASVQTLARREHRSRFARQHFDYIIIDEFHHAAAQTYRELLHHFDPAFMLGLTATPERSDGGDLLDLCDQNLVYRCDLGRGIREGHLSPFHYQGVPDLVDYSNIPWRSSRFDPTELDAALVTEARADNALEQWRRHAGEGSRTIGFCVSQRHAMFMRDHFRAAGVMANAVHSGTSSDSRTESLAQLEAGELEVVFAVDMFNEGLDIRSVDTVLMLRPTESRILWLQQIGRGLRKSPGKAHLQIVDYIGNHRSFLAKPAALLGALGLEVPSLTELSRALARDAFAADLPPGCAVTYELEAKAILERLFPPTRAAETLAEWYRSYRDANEVRPSALQALRAGKDTQAAWLALVEREGDLDADHQRARLRYGAFLSALETAVIDDGAELLVIEALLHGEALLTPVEFAVLSDEFVRACARSPARRAMTAAPLDQPDRIPAYLRTHAIEPWTRRVDERGQPLFALREHALGPGPGLPASESPEQSAALAELVAELLDWRIAVHLRESSSQLRLEVRRDSAGTVYLGLDRPRGAPSPEPSSEPWLDVEVDGEPLRARFEGQRVLVSDSARATADPDPIARVVTRWFGANAGARGTKHAIVQVRDEQGRHRWVPVGQLIVRGDDGRPLDARALVEDRDGAATLVLESRGGGRNNAYKPALELLLARLARVGATIERIAVESSKTDHLDLDARTLAVADQPYPIALSSGTDAASLRGAIGSAVAKLGRAPAARGSGNAEKRIRLWVGGVGLDQLRALVLADPAAGDR